MTALTGVCSHCGRVRCGSQWVRVEAGKALEPSTLCPSCKGALYPALRVNREVSK